MSFSIEKMLWNNSDFADMGWHDCRIYSLALPSDDFIIKLDIDYIFKWEKLNGVYVGFYVSPCDLNFYNVAGTKICFDYEQTKSASIINIKRSNERTSPNGETFIWDYMLECDIGTISFSSTGYEQVVRREPVFSQSQDLGR